MVDVTGSVPGYVTVMQAASRLSVTPNQVRALIASRELAARKVGSQWLVETASINSRLERPPHNGRRFTPANAWAVLLLAVNLPAPWLDRQTRWRLTTYLEERPLRSLRSRLVSRGTLMPFRAHRSVLSGLRADPALMATGVSAQATRRAGLFGGDESVDGYVPSTDIAALITRYHLAEARSEAANVSLRVVPFFGSPWPFAPEAPVSAVALDLLESTEPRLRQVGDELLRQFDR